MPWRQIWETVLLLLKMYTMFKRSMLLPHVAFQDNQSVSKFDQILDNVRAKMGPNPLAISLKLSTNDESSAVPFYYDR